MKIVQSQRRFVVRLMVLVSLAAVWFSGGCAPTYKQLRMEGQRAMSNGEYAVARHLFEAADERDPQRVPNLYDLGSCSVMLSRQKFSERNHAAAMREVDAAIGYYERAIAMHPGHQPSLEGKNIALELKGQFDKALEHAEWMTKFVGPSAKQHVFLARELEERGDFDGAFLRYRQAVAMEPDNPEAHIAFAEFLFRQNKDEAAIAHLQAAYRLDPYNREVAQQLIDRHALPPINSKTKKD